MTTSPIHHVKIGSSPTPQSWSQSYAAGTLFAVVSLSLPEINDSISLSTLGKEVINTLEEEYFTLEEKKLEAIQKAIETTLSKIPEGLVASLGVVSIVKNVIYGFVKGSTTIAIQRKGVTKTLLSGSADTALEAISGHAEYGDVYLLATKSFIHIVPVETFFTSGSLEQTEEKIAPLLQEKEEGTACAVGISYLQDANEPEPAEKFSEPIIHESMIEVEQEQTEVNQPETTEPPLTTTHKKSFSLPVSQILAIPRSLLERFLHLSHRKKLFLSIAVILAVALIVSIYLAKKQEENARAQALFAATYTQAEQKYEEGQSLATLNKNLSRESLNEAQKILKEALAALPKGSEEEQKTSALLTKVEKTLAEVSGSSVADAQEVNLSDNPLLEAIAKQKAIDGVSIGNSLFLLTKDGITKDSKQIVSKNDAGTNPVGIGNYQTNLYVLDTKDGIFKFVPSGNTYTKSSYLTSEVDLSNAADLSLDTAVWVLFKDGTIQKFLRGKAEPFSISGLDTPLKSPKKIDTNTDAKNIYILDSGNGRIVVLDKTGAYQSQYQTGFAKTATHFAVDDAAKKIYLLSGSKLYQIDLK